MVKVGEQGIIENLKDKTSNVFYDEIMYFASCIINNLPVDKCPPEDSAEALRMIEAEFKSSDNNGEKIIMY